MRQKFLFLVVILSLITAAVAVQSYGDCAKLNQHCSAFKKCCEGLSCHPFIMKCYHSPREYGEPCSAGYGCGPDLSCQPGVHKCYHSPRQFGEPCSAGYECGPGLSCEAGTQKCTHNPRLLGEPCGGYYSCVPGLQCGSDYKCYHNPRLVGEPCNSQGYSLICNPPSQCKNGKCAEPPPPPDCSKCNTFPQLCNDIENCVKNCNLGSFHAKSCYDYKYISLETCKKVYNKCDYVDPCGKCGLFPNWCEDLENCVNNCNLHPSWAQSCYDQRYISKELCKKVYPACKDLDPRCYSYACLSYPTLCSHIEFCVQNCRITSFSAINCYKEGLINLETCKKANPDCK